MRIVLLLVSVLLLCVPVSAQTWWVGPGDTVKIPLVLYDSINNPAAVDSAADSVLIRVVKNFAANAGGADTCYLHRGLMDASTNTNLHTTGNATTTLGFGQTPKRVQTFSFFATAYTLTNSATASGTYTIEVFTYDHSLNLITTRFYSMNYLYVAANTNTFAHWADSMIRAPRQLDSATSKVGVGDNAIGAAEMAASSITSSEAPNLDAAVSSRSTLVTTDNIGINWGDITNSTSPQTLSGTTVGTATAVTNGVTVTTNNDKTGYSLATAPLVPGDTDELRNNIVTALGIPLKPSDTDELRNNIVTALGIPLKPSDTDELRANIVAAIPNNEVWSAAQRDTVLNRTLVTKDSTYAVLDTLQNVSSALRVDTNTTWTAAQRDTLLNRSLVTKDSTYAVLDTLQNTSSSLRVDTNTVWSAAQRDTLLNRSLVTKDSVYATLDTLQNGSSTLRVATVDTAAISKSVKERLFADTAKKIGFSGGGGDSVKAVAMASVDSAAVARSVWDNDITVQANRTVTANMTFDTVLLDKARDSVNAILDTLQNLSSTLRLAGSDLDTVYQVVQCDDTMAGDFLLTLADYRAQIKHKMGVAQTNTTWMTDSVLNQLTREAIVTVNPIMRGYKTSITKVTQFDSSDYPLDSLVGVGSVVWYKNDTARSIPYLAREKWATLTQQTTWGADDPYMERPQVYDYTDDQISFFPTPTSNDSVKINGWAKVPNITVISAVSQIPQKYRVAVLKYATWLVARAKQHQSAQTFLDEYHESLAFLVAGLNETQADSK